MNGQEILQALLEGNRRFAEGRSRHPNQDPERRRACAGGQQPPAAVLACADSRVAPELVFDQGLGDLFVTRVAGNLVNDMVLASLEYAVEHLGTRLILVLGHKRCGAVAAAVEGGDLPGHLPCLVRPLKAAVQQAEGRPDPVDHAARANVRNMVAALGTASHILAEFVEQGGLQLAGAYYDIDNGRVELIE